MSYTDNQHRIREQQAREGHLSTRPDQLFVKRESKVFHHRVAESSNVGLVGRNSRRVVVAGDLEERSVHGGESKTPGGEGENGTVLNGKSTVHRSEEDVESVGEKAQDEFYVLEVLQYNKKT